MIKIRNEQGQIVEITDEQYQEELKKGKENGYKLWLGVVNRIAESNNCTIREVLVAIRLLRDYDLHEIVGWYDSRNFIQRLNEELASSEATQYQ